MHHTLGSNAIVFRKNIFFVSRGLEHVVDNFVSMFEKYNSTTILKYVNKYNHFLESIFRIDFENNRDFMVFYVLVILAMMF